MTVRDRRSWRVVAAAVVCGLWLASNAPMTAAQEPVQLVTQAQVEEVIGTTVRVKTRGDNGYSYTSSSPLGTVTIDITPAEVVDTLKGDNASIDGLGDDAFFMSNSSRMAVLIARKGTQASPSPCSFRSERRPA